MFHLGGQARDEGHGPAQEQEDDDEGSVGEYLLQGVQVRDPANDKQLFSPISIAAESRGLIGHENLIGTRLSCKVFRIRECWKYMKPISKYNRLRPVAGHTLTRKN